MKRVAVYCGSSEGARPAYAEAARAVGTALAMRGIGTVYGGGRLGLMGMVADSALVAGGEVDGVIPSALVELEVAHTGLTRLHKVETMHERKALMTELSDGFIVMPGGIGTLDELFEAWSWNALGYHSKPFGLLNINGYWNELASFLDRVTTEGFMSAKRREKLIVSDNINELIDALGEGAGTEAGMIW
ncbi:TIGR00730 family Rossman fold protein [Pacificimonas sp. WHA3]|uniref:Cytokinin riboside 5'-monophosphate phosphoribohydrolase n=1 Tax=Pacificimonas pallii TaxID=2827236 RepID=A0ABS6SHA9_9SPHN|nr:TIGR00730 family Rossman fold protein [Pacificimonas pallii]MBV7257785.1 TIGR00730 family Rossman fold protein [Pacificimonas pallii]